MDGFFYIGSTSAPDEMIGVEIHGSAALLRSLVVSSTLRNRGLGGVLVARAEQYARDQGVNTMYLLTMTAEQFFRALTAEYMELSAPNRAPIAMMPPIE